MPDPDSLIPRHFQFNQGNLNDFLACPYRFKLKHVDHLAWPAPVSEPLFELEKKGLLGSTFHRLVQQHQIGIDTRLLDKTIAGLSTQDTYQELPGWWRNYQDFVAAADLGTTYPELTLVTRLAGYRLSARLDLLSLTRRDSDQAVRALIVDWKTTSKPARRDALTISLQSRVYRYTLVRYGEQVRPGSPITPEQVELLYWYANSPGLSIRLQYNQDLYLDDERVLADLILDISRRAENDFGLTEKVKNCIFCGYRSLCDRGTSAGNVADLDGEDGEEAIDFSSIEEIAF